MITARDLLAASAPHEVPAWYNHEPFSPQACPDPSDEQWRMNYTEITVARRFMAGIVTSSPSHPWRGAFDKWDKARQDYEATFNIERALSWPYAYADLVLAHDPKSEVSA